LRKKGKLFLRKLIPALLVSDADVSTAAGGMVAGSVGPPEHFLSAVVLVVVVQEEGKVVLCPAPATGCTFFFVFWFASSTEDDDESGDVLVVMYVSLSEFTFSFLVERMLLSSLETCVRDDEESNVVEISGQTPGLQ